MTLRNFQKKIWEYYRAHKRHLPWRPKKATTDRYSPYYVVVSEIMLQQTQVNRVIPKFIEFIKKFPSFKDLAQASTHDVLTVWQGLGYNRRGLALKKCADIVMKQYNGNLPKETEELLLFPSIGIHTAQSIRAFAFNIPTVFIETNIRTVYLHFFFEKRIKAGEKISDKEILPFVEKTVDPIHAREWYYALMDYGSMLKIQLKKEGKIDPARTSLHYKKQSPFKNSNRQLRARILREILAGARYDISTAKSNDKKINKRVRENLQALEKEGFIRAHNNTYIVVQ